MKVKLPKGGGLSRTTELLRARLLATVCEHAGCPNRIECYSRGTATFLILGTICTRNCAFCGVASGTPEAVDHREPERLAETVADLGLQHVVVTCVTRDDLPDGGAAQFCRTLAAIRRRTAATVEVLPSDFGGNFRAIDQLADARPDVYNYNVETVPRLFHPIRGPVPNYRRTLDIFRHLSRRSPAMLLKSGIMLGLGETDTEVLETLCDLHDAGCRVITIGQYLQPSSDHYPVQRFVAPEAFQHWRILAESLGFEHVAAGPLVRSSYHAGEAFQQVLCG
jgi:lipoic acid synthetase